MIATKPSGRSLSVPLLLAAIFVYLLIVQGVGLLLTADEGYDYSTFPTTEPIVRAVTIPVGVSVLFGVLLVSWLRWRDRVLTESLPLARWAWAFPAVMAVSIVAVTDYGLLSDVSGAHITNIFTEGPGAFVQALVVSVYRLSFYVAQRVSGGLLVPVLLPPVGTSVSSRGDSATTPTSTRRRYSRHAPASCWP